MGYLIQRSSKAYLAKKPQDLEAAAIDLEGGRAGEAVQTVPKGRHEVEKDLRHCGWKYGQLQVVLSSHW